MAARKKMPGSIRRRVNLFLSKERAFSLVKSPVILPIISMVRHTNAMMGLLQLRLEGRLAITN